MAFGELGKAEGTLQGGCVSGGPQVLKGGKWRQMGAGDPRHGKTRAFADRGAKKDRRGGHELTQGN